DGIVHHRDGVGADGIHLRMEFKTGDAVADFDERRRAVLLDHGLPLFNRLQQRYAVPARYLFVLTRSDVKEPGPALASFVERFLSASQETIDQRWNGLPFLFETRHRLFHADHIPQLERAELVVESPLNSVVDSDNVVSYLRDAIPGIDQIRDDRLPEKLTGPVRAID